VPSDAEQDGSEYRSQKAQTGDGSSCTALYPREISTEQSTGKNKEDCGGLEYVRSL